MARAGATLLSLDAGKALMFDKAQMIAAADDAGIALVGRATGRRGMSAPLRLGVVGVGHLGRHHARLLATMPGVRLVGVVDDNAGAGAGDRRRRRHRRAHRRGRPSTGRSTP